VSKISLYTPEQLGAKRPVDGRQSSSQGTRIERDPQAFQSLLKQELAKQEGIKFSAHAQSRLLNRQIALTQYDLDRLEQAVGKAAEKGAKESLIVMQDLAFIVSVPNKTVITVTSRDQAKENVFTNIDSTILI